MTWRAVFLGTLAAGVVFRLYLSFRQERHVLARRGRVPEAFAGRVTPEEHDKAARYTAARLRLGRFATAYDAALLLLWTLGGGIDLLAGLWPRGVLGGTGLLLSAAAASALLALPLSAWSTFVLEERFGFNRTTPRTFLADLFKGALVGLVLGAPLAAAVLWLMHAAGRAWWLWAWAVWTAFGLFVTWIFPAWIAPLFHRFTRLQDEALAARLRALLDRVGFSHEGVFVIDGSRRSSHGNAFFAGFGRHRRIALYDTLVERLAPDEIEAVLAHEVGHSKLGHVWKGSLVSAAAGLGALFLLSRLAAAPWFYEGIGVHDARPATALLLFAWVGPVFGFWLLPLWSAWSRRNEFQADDYAREHAGGAALARALVKLHKDNASPLASDPLYIAVYASHPDASVRIPRLEPVAPVV